MKIHHICRRLVLAIAICLMLLQGAEAASPTFKWSIKTFEKKESGWRFAYSYPELSAPGAPADVEKMVKDFNDRMGRDIEEEFTIFTREMKNNPVPQEAPDVPSDHRVSCKSVGEDPQYASFLCEHVEFISGMAHPDSWYSTINWSADGKFFSIEDLFLPGAKAWERLSGESKRLLKGKLGENGSVLIPEGWAPKADNFKNFCISPEGLCIYFNPYQVGPRFIGGPDILIPWKSLEVVLSPMAKHLLKH